jgi:hypothetical protein
VKTPTAGVQRTASILRNFERIMGRIERTREIARRRARRVKLKKLRQRFASAKSEAEKADVRARVRRLSPFATLD